MSFIGRRVFRLQMRRREETTKRLVRVVSYHLSAPPPLQKNGNFSFVYRGIYNIYVRALLS